MLWYIVRTCRFCFRGAQARYKFGLGRRFIRYVLVLPVSFPKQYRGSLGVPTGGHLDAKPQWVYASLLALSTLLWRREVPARAYTSRFWDKKKFTDVTLDEWAPFQDSDAAEDWDVPPEAMGRTPPPPEPPLT